MDGLYYKKEFVIGPNQEKFGLLAVDSCLLLCHELLTTDKKNFERYDEESKAVFLSWCEGGGPLVEYGQK